MLAGRERVMGGLPERHAGLLRQGIRFEPRAEARRAKLGGKTVQAATRLTNWGGGRGWRNSQPLSDKARSGPCRPLPTRSLTTHVWLTRFVSRYMYGSITRHVCVLVSLTVDVVAFRTHVP